VEPAHPRLDNLLSITAATTTGKPTGFALYLDGTITADKDGRPLGGRPPAEHPWGVPAEPLVYKPRVGRPFGTSRISRPVMSLHDQALRTVIRMEGHADVYSFPEMWLLGADESIFKNADGTQKAVVAGHAGPHQGIPDDDDADNPRADVKQFSGVVAAAAHRPAQAAGAAVLRRDVDPADVARASRTCRTRRRRTPTSPRVRI
jgi:hypothetical protein